MSYNGSGTYVPPAGQPVATGTVIQSATFNTLVTDIGNTFNNVLPRDGQASMQGQLKITDGTSSVPSIAFNSEASTGIYRPIQGTLAMVASGVENLRINSAGRVLIGTSTDDGINTLQVNGPVKVSGAFNATGAATLASTLNVSGSVTAPSFIGSLTGNVSGNVTGDVSGNVTGTAANITGVAAVANGGTGATTAAAALANLGAASVSSPTINTPTIVGYIEKFQALNPGAAVTINPSAGTLIELSITANTTITLPAAVAGMSYTVIASYTGAYSLTFTGGSTLRWAGGTAPTATSANGKSDKYVFTCGSSYTLAQDGGRNF